MLLNTEQLAIRQLQQGCESLSLILSDEQINRLMAYLIFLKRWNNVYNLTSINSLSLMVSHHLLDCLAILPWVKGPTVLDVGSGAGLPGLVWALVDDSFSITLLDSNGKKGRFLQQAKLEFKLDHVTVIQERVESWHPDQTFSQITSRAFAHLTQFIDITRHLLANEGEWLAMLGREPTDLLTGVDLVEAVKLTVPFVAGERHLWRLSKNNSTHLETRK